MSDKHVTVSGVVFHNPGQVAQPVSAGQSPAPAPKPAGNPNGAVHGQAPGTTVIIDNPA